MDRVPSRRAEPAERCPNCGEWFAMGECRHWSSAGPGTLYNVCSFCAERHDDVGGAFDKLFRKALTS